MCAEYADDAWWSLCVFVFGQSRISRNKAHCPNTGRKSYYHSGSGYAVIIFRVRIFLTRYEYLRSRQKNIHKIGRTTNASIQFKLVPFTYANITQTYICKCRCGAKRQIMRARAWAHIALNTVSLLRYADFRN